MKHKILFIGTVWPEPRSSAAGVRTRALVEQCLESSKFEVHFASPSLVNEYTEELKRLGVETHSVMSNDGAFDPWVRALSPDVVVFDRFVLEEQFGWRVRENAPHALNVIDTQDLHFLRDAREEAIRKDPSDASLLKIFKGDLNFRARDSWIREIGSIYRADLSLMISSFETEFLKTRFGLPTDRLITLPFSYRIREPAAFKMESRKNFMMIGNFRHAPNADAFDWMRNELWPKIRAELPDLEMHVYGAYPPKEAMSASDPARGFIVKGPTIDSIETLKGYRALLAPLRFGAGIKGKIADAWAAGTPVVTTPIGSEGMEIHGEFAGLTARNTEEFVRAAVRLGRGNAESNQLGLGLSKFASVALSKLFDWEERAKDWIQALETSLKNLSALREKNRTGEILRYEAFQSKRYLSKWIEEKNKKKE